MITRAIGAAFQAICIVITMFAIGPAHAEVQPIPAPERQILVMLKMAPPHFRPNTSYGGTYGDAMSKAARLRIAKRIARDNGLGLVRGWPMPRLGVDCYVMQLPAGMSSETAIEQVSRDPMVAWSEPVAMYQALSLAGTPDPLLPVAPATASWRLADLHRYATGRGVSVAIVDSRIDVSHPDLSGQFTASRDFVGNRPGPPERHGTEIAGIIGAKADNGLGSAGIAPGARMMALRACWQASTRGQTLCDSLSLARALLYAIEHNAQVINLSLSGPTSPLLRKLLDIALERRAAVVAAFDPTLPRGGFPASHPGVIAVVDESLQKLPAGLYGAPGRQVPTTQPGGKWNLVSGSSYAAAHVSGLVALVRERFRSAESPVQIVRSSRGVVDACATLLRTASGCDCSCTLAQKSVAVAHH